MRRAALAAAGVGWLALIVAKLLERGDTLSYDGYYRFFSLSLALVIVAWLGLRSRIPGRAFWIALAGLVILSMGNALEFWGVLVVDGVNVNVSGEEAWWGSDAGWMMAMPGFLLTIGGGVAAAIAARRAHALPTWAVVFVGALGVGVILANLLLDAPPAVAVVGLGWFAAGWLALAARLRPA